MRVEVEEGRLASVDHATFVLKEPHTVQSLRDGAALQSEHGRTRWCKLFGCKWRTVGEPWMAPLGANATHEEVIRAALTMVGNMDSRDMQRCERCLRIRVRSRF